MLSTTQLRAFSDDDLTGEIQDILAALADVEVRYEVARERLAEWSGSEAEKERLGREINAHYRRSREPLAGILAELHQRMMARSLQEYLR